MCGLLIGLAACNGDGVNSAPGSNLPATPVISATATAGTGNVLSARVAFGITAATADSVRVTYSAADGAVAATPFRVTAASDSIVMLGLRPATAYTANVEVAVGGKITRSPALTFQTGTLPAAVAGFSLRPIRGTPSAYSATGLTIGGSWAVVFDSTGQVAWYKDLSTFGVPVNNVVQQPNGNITAFLGASPGWTDANGSYVEITPGGDIVRTYRAPIGFYTDSHELLITGSGASLRAHFYTYDRRTVDLSASGGSPTAIVAGHQLVRMDAAGTVEFTWNAWDHLSLGDKVGEEQGKDLANTDFDHPNALAFDPAGNYVASWRDFNQVTAINAQTGAFVWRVGGPRGEYRFVGDARNGFSKQHYTRILPNGNLLLYDNGSDLATPESRAVEYKLDHTAKTATMVWEYRHSPAIYTQFVGNVNRLANGNSWIGFAGIGRVVEASPSGETVWEAQLTSNGTDATGYRIVPLRSLYEYAVP